MSPQLVAASNTNTLSIVLVGLRGGIVAVSKIDCFVDCVVTCGSEIANCHKVKPAAPSPVLKSKLEPRMREGIGHHIDITDEEYVCCDYLQNLSTGRVSYCKTNIFAARLEPTQIPE